MSRLDRLVLLLDTGSSAFIRNTAADQLSDSAKNHPEEVLNILTRVYPYLKSKKWETRICSARAFGGIVGNIPVWDPNENQNDVKVEVKQELGAELKQEDDVEMKQEDEEEKIKVKAEVKEETETLENLLDLSDNIKLDELDFAKLIADCPKLVSSGIPLVDMNNDKNLMENLKHLKQLLNARLGTGDPQLLVKQEQEFKRKKMEQEAKKVEQEKQEALKMMESKNNVQKVQDTSAQATKGSAARLRAAARRRAKMAASSLQSKSSPVNLTQSSLHSTIESENGTSNGGDDGTGSVMKSEPSKFELTSQADANTLVLETKVSSISFEDSAINDRIWIFQGLYELLLFDLFHPDWEVRHGSALGLKELLKNHSKSINRIKGYTLEENNKRNLEALEDLSVKILTLFALDRFGDYISDNVIAPVRESTAQALAALLNNIDDKDIFQRQLLNQIFAKLLELVEQKSWEAAHGGMLGLKYVVSIKSDFIFNDSKVFMNVIQVVLTGLASHVEEIQSESAALLVPIIDKILPHEKWLMRIVEIIWSILDTLQDDLKSSLKNLLALISELSNHSEVLNIMKIMSQSSENDYSFENLVPKLYPFLRHSISNIRRSVLQTFVSFARVEPDMEESVYWFQDPLLMRLVFQNLLFEQHEDILELSEEVFVTLVRKNKSLQSFGPHLQNLLNLIMVPLGVNRVNYHMNNSDVLKPTGEPLALPEQTVNSTDNGKRGRKRKTPNSNSIEETDSLHVNIDAPIMKGDLALLGSEVFIRTRLMAAKNFGLALSQFNADSEFVDALMPRLKSYLNSHFSSTRIFTALILQQYFTHCGPERMSSKWAEILEPVLLKYLNEPDGKLPFYRELVPLLKNLRNSCSELFLRFEENGQIPHSKIPLLPVVVQGEKQAGNNAFSVADAEKVVTHHYNKLMKNLSGGTKFTLAETLETSKQTIINLSANLVELRNSRNVTVLGFYASAALAIRRAVSNSLPPKLNPFIRCLMDSVKSDEALYQKFTCLVVSDLVSRLVEAGKMKVADKIVRNLSSYLCVQFPEFAHNQQTSTIYTLEIQKSVAKIKNENASMAKVLGSKAVLGHLLKKYKQDVFDKLKVLKDLLFEPSKTLLCGAVEEDNVAFDEKQSQTIIDSIGLLESLASDLSQELVFDNFELIALFSCLKAKHSVLRYAAAKCLATLAKLYPENTIPFVVTQVLPLLKNASFVHHRQGAIETVYHLSSIMGNTILPFVIFFIVPVLGRMSDSNEDVRVLATSTFASIIKLVPLEAGIADPENMPAELLANREKERSFLKELMNPQSIPDYELPVAVKATLRSYQKAGVNWLHFLNRYNLHGILCDDMGLGKTLQTICIVSSDHHTRMEKFKETQSPEWRRLSSLVVCPPSVMGHWEQEIGQYAPFMKVLVYAGPPSVRQPLRKFFSENDVIVTSYDVVRNDCDYLSELSFNYAVLDEGHMIKNSSSKLAKSVKKIHAEHRLILTGTPIQNNVLELWSLFDFLMPGFLGTEKFFQEKFSKPIAASRSAKTSSKEQEAGALALEALHKQVLPFMLRRLKSEVLNDLPPKIIQDRYCELSTVQKAMYNDFAKKQRSVVEELGNEPPEEEGKGKQHVFEALQYMRKLCNHPALVLTKDHPNYAQVQQYLEKSGQDINDIRNAPKLLDLKNLLIDCGIGGNSTSVISQHRALIFCQLKEMLDKVETDLLQKHLPQVTYMRMDGSTEPRARQQLVTKFNSDPSIDVLLLTTRVGGLGLNLTGADTVIFVEHDWNPMNDLQAMDRAHRLGQTKAVNVYRLITRNTLEEKIMSLQQFKVNVASAVVNQQNNSLNTMETSELLDLFSVDDEEKPEATEKKDKEEIDDLGLGGKAKKAIGALGDVWDEGQYEDYDVRKFASEVKK